MEKEGRGKPEGSIQLKKMATEYARQEGWSVGVCAKCSLEIVATFVEQEE